MTPLIPSPYPLGLAAGFVALVSVAIAAFYFLTGRSRRFLLGAAGWLALHGGLAATGFYAGNADAAPPRLAFALVPSLALAGLIGFGPLGYRLRTAASLEGLHYFHAVRVIVELVFLHGLARAGLIAPQLSYTGSNYDLYAGLTGPVVGLLVFRLRWLPRSVAAVWNVAALVTLATTVAQAVLSVPSPWQRLAFEQPTVAVLHLPFVWLPAMVMPLVVCPLPLPFPPHRGFTPSPLGTG